MSLNIVYLFSLFTLGLATSPSLFRYFVHDYFIVLLALITFFISISILFRTRFNQEHFLLFLVISCYFIFIFILNFSMYNVPKWVVFLYSIIVIFVWRIIAHNDFKVNLLLVKFWVLFFEILTTMVVITWLLYMIAPGLFFDVNFAEGYSGNDRSYKAWYTGFLIIEDYGSYTKNRAVGFLAEPGMMSMLFVFNAYISTFYKSKIFNYKFAAKNIVAALLCYSLSGFIAVFMLAVLLVIFKLKKTIIKYFIMLSVPLLVFLVGIDFIYSYLESTSMSKRLLIYLNRLNGVDNIMIFFIGGFGNIGELRVDVPSAIITLFINTGLLGVLFYMYYFFRDILKKFPYVFILFLPYLFSIQFQTFFVFVFMFMVVISYSIVFYNWSNFNNNDSSI